jgi:hypothetical protein
MAFVAVPAKNPSYRDRERSPDGSFKRVEATLKAGDVMEAAAKLYGLGFKKAQVARALESYLGTYKAARHRLTKWEQTKEFRDLVWTHAVVKADLALPAVLQGVTSAAKKGRVDAAKLMLGVTDRYTEKSDVPTEVTISLTGTIPRPAIQSDEAKEIRRQKELPEKT